MGKSRDERSEGITDAKTVRRGTNHPSKSLEARRNGFGIGGGYERPLTTKDLARTGRFYGPLPHAGYYGTGSPVIRFSVGQAGFNQEAAWFEEQFGEKTSEGAGEPATDAHR